MFRGFTFPELLLVVRGEVQPNISGQKIIVIGQGRGESVIGLEFPENIARNGVLMNFGVCRLPPEGFRENFWKKSFTRRFLLEQ